MNNHIKMITSHVAQYMEINQQDLFRRSRRANIVLARAICMYMLKRMENGLTLSEIGRIFGLSHTSVIHNINTIKKSRKKLITANNLIKEIEILDKGQNENFITIKERNSLLFTLWTLLINKRRENQLIIMKSIQY